MLHICPILLWLLQSITGIVDEIVHEDRFGSLLYPYRTTLLIFGTAPSAINYSIVVSSHLGKRNHLTIACIREFEGVGAGVVDDIVGNIEFATSLHVDSLTTISSISAIGEDIVDNHTITASKVSLVVIVVVEETVSHHKLTIHITEMESRHTTIDGGFEKFVLERSRTLGRSSAGIGHIHVVEYHLLRIVSADDATPIGRLLGIRSKGDRFFGSTHAIEITQYYDFHRHLNLRFAGNGYARLDIERSTHRNLHALAEGSILAPN